MSAPRKRSAFVRMARPEAPSPALVVVSGIAVLYAATAVGLAAAGQSGQQCGFEEFHVAGRVLVAQLDAAAVADRRGPRCRRE